MRILTPFQALGAVALAATLAACSGNTTVSPSPVARQAVGRGVTGQHDSLNITTAPRRHLASYYSCPRHGSIEYVSDYSNDVVYVYVGKFAGQAPCGQITSGLYRPAGLYVDTSTHDLYATSYVNGNILVFHRGQTTPYNLYTDPSGQLVRDIGLAKDGTVIASNVESFTALEKGSISTWLPGPNGGTFVGNFPMTNDQTGGNLALKRDGTVFYNDTASNGQPQLWKVSCPAGACGAERQVTGVSIVSYGGMVFDNTGDLLLSESGNCSVDTFELPNTQPSKFGLSCYPSGIALDAIHNHFFDAVYDTSTLSSYAQEYSYPSMTLIGSTAEVYKSDSLGIAVDP